MHQPIGMQPGKPWSTVGRDSFSWWLSNEKQSQWRFWWRMMANTREMAEALERVTNFDAEGAPRKMFLQLGSPNRNVAPLPVESPKWRLILLGYDWPSLLASPFIYPLLRRGYPGMTCWGITAGLGLTSEFQKLIPTAATATRPRWNKTRTLSSSLSAGPHGSAASATCSGGLSPAVLQLLLSLL